MNPRVVTVLKVTAPLAVVAAASLTALALAGMRPQPEARAPEIPVPLVRVQRVELAPVPLTVQSQGSVRPRTESRLVPEVAGRLVWVAPSFANGGFFEAGEALARIDPHDYEQALVGALAEVAAAQLRLAQEEAEAELARKEWAELGEGSPPELTARVPQLENARASVAAAEAAVERARRDLDRTEIRAPYAGRIRDKSVDLGQYVTPGTVLATVYAIDVAEIRLPLPDEDLAFLDLPLGYRGESLPRGPRVTLTGDFAGRTHAWQGRVVRTEGEIDAATRMVHAVAEVRDPYRRGTDAERPPLAVGMYVRAEIEGVVAPAAAVIPRSAVREDGRVAILGPGDRLLLREIQVIRRTRDVVVVSAGLADGDRVILSPLEAPVEGMALRVASAPEVPPEAPAEEPGQ